MASVRVVLHQRHRNAAGVLHAKENKVISTANRAPFNGVHLFQNGTGTRNLVTRNIFGPSRTRTRP